MNDEIKEILYKLDAISNGAYNNDGYLELNPNEAKKLLDYITKLQQENERKERLITQYGDGMCAYANRIDKAIEYMQNENNITKHGIYPNYTYEVDTKELLNILQHGSEK